MAKILLVEDDNNLREIYEARLQVEGYTIVSARDGEEALVVAKAEKPDLIISDIMMPKISGFEMLDILRNTDDLKHVKIIMLTALGQSDDQKRADKLGADRYLVKSQVTLEDIVKAAHDLLADESTPPVVAGVTSQPTPPVAAPPAAPPDPAPDPAPAAKPETTVASNEATETDDKLMNDAVNTLIADTEEKDKPEAKLPGKKTAPLTKPRKISAAASIKEEKKPDNTETETDASASPEDTESSASHVAIAHKKVIKPIESKPKKDLATLLALEEAEEAKATAGSVSETDETEEAGTTEDEEAAAEAAKSSQAATTAAAEEAAVDAKIEDFVAGATTEPTPPSAIKPAEPPAAPADAPATTAPSDGPKTIPVNDAKKPPDPNIIAL